MLGYHFDTSDELRSLDRCTQRRGLEVSNIMGWQDLVTPDLKIRKKRVAMLKDRVSTAVGVDISEEKAWDALVGSLSDVVAAAEKNDIVVTIEAVFNIQNSIRN